MGGDSEDVILLSARQLILRRDDLDIVSSSLLKAILRQLQLAARQFLAITRHSYLFGGRVQVQECLAKILLNAETKICDLIVNALDAAGKFLGLSAAIAVEKREVDLALHQSCGLDAADAAPNLADVSVETQFGIGARPVGALLFEQSFALAQKREIVGAGSESRAR